ncbi:NAD(P)H-dependent oxidoreductase [Nonomuraea sp. NN258]|uniref:NADPH-dependent FMN reductase n=1 Tax=Nonomuraea antri TaxID=2730852 RepID=UPI0015687C3A|nr:NAD(P)H-dependent oxidoreductase [Nonomuraea antri]NRQ31694.1 NAD(P)H-dependent oxidoreductase [Nonomuraea antri]
MSYAPLQLAVIIASTRQGRVGPVVADWFVGQARRHTAMEIDVIDLAATPLPLAVTSSPAKETADLLAPVSARLAAAEAFVVVTPEYNHSFPATIKILIDWHYTQWRAKPVGFVCYGGRSGGLRAVEHLRLVFAELHAVTIRETLSFHSAWNRPGDSREQMIPAESDGAAKIMLDQLAWWGQALREARAAHPYEV